MSEDTTGDRRFDEEDVGASVHDTGGGGEIGTIRDYDDDRVYVEPSDDADHEKLDALGWRASDGSFEIDTDAVEGLPEDAEGDHGVDLSAYEDPDDESGGESG